jgi:hypothetical protein
VQEMVNKLAGKYAQKLENTLEKIESLFLFLLFSAVCGQFSALHPQLSFDVLNLIDLINPII